jgi:hypothetical protein
VGTLAHSDEHQNVIFSKVEKALLLIQTHDPIRFRQIQRYVQLIFIFGDPSANGYWHQELRMCELEETFVRGEATSIAEVASAIVHEATHARLMRLGFGYEEPKRLRIEQICFDAEQAFARRLPDDQELVREMQEKRAYYGETDFSDAGRREAHLEGLRNLRVPKWIVWVLAKLFPGRTRTNPNREH